MALVVAGTMLGGAGAAGAAPFTFSTGTPDGKIALASRPGGPGVEIEAADDFVLADATSLSGLAFTGLLPLSAAPTEVRVRFYAVFPTGSDTSRTSGAPTFSTSLVPTRVNSPSDGALATRDSTDGGLTFATTVLASSFAASNSVLNGINPRPNQTTGGDGAVSGQETVVDASFAAPVTLPAGRYFVVPQVKLASGQFYWLSAARSTASDLQAWIRNANLVPDWLRVGTDIVGGATPPTDNAAFTLRGATCSPIAVAPAALPPWTAGSAYDATMSASGGAAPYAFTASGSVPPGTSLSASGRLTGTPTQTGTSAFAVTATDATGCTGSRSYAVDVAAAPDTSAPPAAVQPPAITRARLSPRRFRAAKGTTITYTDSRAATTTLAVARVTTGHRAGRRCRAGRPRHGQRSCTRLVARGAFIHQDAGGAVRVRFRGRVGRRRLAPGRYRLSLTPRADGRTGRTVVLAFTVLRAA